MQRAGVLLYGLVVYTSFLGCFLYLVGWLANVVVPRSVDVGPESTTATALAVDLALLLLFALQHSVMARPAFKRAWTRVVKEPIERSTYVLATNAVLVLLFWQWRPLATPVWTVESAAGAAALWTLFAAGLGIVLVATFLIDHFDLFGLRQVFGFFQDRPPQAPAFKSRSFYRLVRHPLMAGWIVSFWATPRMTAGHLLFAAVATLYILVAIVIEERDLLEAHGETYARYRREVPMLVPFLKPRGGPPAHGSPS